MNENLQNLLNNIKTDVSGKWINIEVLKEAIPNILVECLKEVKRTNVQPCGYTIRDVSIAECAKERSIKRVAEHYGLPTYLGKNYD